MTKRLEWPVISRYDQDHLARIAMPLGGIGTGCVSLGGRGDLRDWEIMNRPAKGFAPAGLLRSQGTPFFALRAQKAGEPAVTRVLEGPLNTADYEGASGSPAPNHGLPRFRRCTFAAAYPLGQVLLADDAVPLDVKLEAFNPLIPGDADRSGIPIAVLRFTLTNHTSRRVSASLCGSLANFIGFDGTQGAPKGNLNAFRQGAGFQGVYMSSQGVEQNTAQWGTMALATTAKKVSARTAWKKMGWGSSMLDFWDDFSSDGSAGRARARGRRFADGLTHRDCSSPRSLQPPGDLRAGMAFPESLHLVAV